MTKGKFIVIEGGEGVGKTTLIDGLKKVFVDEEKFIFTREPGATELGKELRRLLLNQESFGRMDPTTELFLFAADRMEHMAKLVAPALADGKNVICDRFAPSTFAYQIRATDAGAEKEKLFHDAHVPIFAKAKPDHYIFLDLPVDKAFARMQSAGKQLDSFETRGVEFHEKVRSGMRGYVESSGVPFTIVDADKTKEELLAEVQNIISNLI